MRAVRESGAFTITNRGEELARLEPTHAASATDAKAAAEGMKAYVRAHPVRGVDFKTLREAGRA